MGLKSSRKLLSAFLTAIIAFSFISICFGILQISTVYNKNYYINGLSDSSVALECEKQLSSKYEALSAKTNIPVDIFNSVTKKYSTTDSLRQAASNLFDENDSKLKNEVRQQYFEDTCKEYFNANNIRYDEKAVKLACEEASDIYSDTVGIHNLDYLKQSIVFNRTKVTRQMSFYVLFTASAVICICLLYKNKQEERLLYISYSLFASSTGCFLYSVLNMIFKPYRDFISTIEPEIFAKAFISMSSKYNLRLMLVSVVLLILAVVSFVIYVRWSKREQFRKDTRFGKIIHKL